MDNISSTMQELALLKFFTVRENFNKYIRYTEDLNFEQETQTVLDALGAYYKEFPEKEAVSIPELIIYNALRNPLTKKKEMYSELFKSLEKLPIDNKVIKENFNSILEKYYCSSALFKITSALDDGEKDIFGTLEEMVNEFKEVKLKLSDSSKSYVSTSLANIVEKQKEFPGLKWRVQSLNKHLGEIRGKTLGHIFARVDTGKTSFVLSEESYWVQQLREDEHIIHFNNEEDGEKLMTRFYQAFLNVDKETLFKYPDRCEAEFKKRGGERFKLYDEAIISIEDIEEQLSMYKCRAIVVDQADKLVFSGHSKLGDVARLQMVYSKLRELSKKYDVHVLTVGQASQSAENKKWLTPTDLDSSKTLKPGEFDYIIGIGKVFADSCSAGVEVRYIHLCKNKLGTGDHAQFEALIDTSRALYREPTYRELEEAYGNFPKDTPPEGLAYLHN